MAKQVAVKKPSTSDLVSEDMNAPLPAFMRGDVEGGKQDIGRDDLEVPRLKLIQGLSPELDEFNSLRPGNFFHTATEHIFTGPFRAVPIYYEKRYMLWNPREAGGGILARADDGVHWNLPNATFDVKLDKKDGGKAVKWRTSQTVQESGLANWGTLNPDDPNSPPAATLMYNYLLAFPDDPELMHAVVTFQRKSITVGRRFNTKLKTIRAPIFGLVFEFSSVKATNNSGQEFYMPAIKGAGRVASEGLYGEYKALNDSFTKAGLNIRDLESAQDEGGTEADDETEEEAETAKGGKRPKY